MKNSFVVLAGASGDLGSRIARELVLQGAYVRALVRPAADTGRLSALPPDRLEVRSVDFQKQDDLARACEGASIVVSAFSGLREVIIDTQSQLLQAAVQADVPRFMPSDFAIDFTQIPDGLNRNLNLRNEFRAKLERARIRPTSILNGAFTDMLTGMAPFILFQQKRILCWGDPDQMMDWTTIADTAAYAASAALDPEAPRFLRIAGDQLSARSLATLMTELTGERHRIFRPGNPGLLRFLIGVTRFFAPAPKEIYPAWQGMQYMHNMYSGLGKFQALDNDRYPMVWTTARQVLARHLGRSEADARWTSGAVSGKAV